MAKLGGFSHLFIEVTDLDRSEQFYHDILGLDLVGRGLINDPRPNSTMALNTRHRLVMVQVDKVEPFRPNSSSIHHAWYLKPDQFDRVQNRMRTAGYKVDDNRAQFRAVGEKSMDIFDPDGHRYQIQSFGPEAGKRIVENVGDVTCGNVRDYAPGEVRPFVKGKFFVVRFEEGFIAYSRWCTHKNGLLAWQPEHWRFHCPFHGATYNRNGESTTFCMDLAPMARHPLSIAPDGTITVRPDESIWVDGFDTSQLACPSAQAAGAAP